MADSLEDVGTGIEIMRFRPNWKENLKAELLYSKQIVSFVDTISDILSFSDIAQNKFSYKFSALDKLSEYQIIYFFYNRKGRYGKFWLQGFKEQFILTDNLNLSSQYIYVQDNGFDKIYKGFERIYIEMANGDLITRKINNAIVVGSDLRLELNTVIDRQANKEDVRIIGRFFLVRFDKDVLEMQSKCKIVSESTLTFIELVKEYPE